MMRVAEFPRKYIVVGLHPEDYKIAVQFSPDERGDIMSDGMHINAAIRMAMTDLPPRRHKLFKTLLSRKRFRQLPWRKTVV